ncbi:MAG: hypothetical protein HOP10_01750 [Chitinophagaceae bacterium]|nr:hypothetical protein [Chitinophagaceae bacterium]
MKKLFLMAAGIFFVSVASSQTLFTYGKYAGDAKDFLRAYNKNTITPSVSKSKSINDYLELYIKSRLKIQEAYDRKYDTLLQIRNEVANLRTQIAENYMTDPAIQEHLVNEAFQRSQKDLHVAHIFISFRTALGFDTTTALKKKDEIVQRLQKGEDFLQVAQQSSDDPAAKNNKGDLGYITVFILPYEFENVIYNTAVGKYSSAVRSKIGYHIFKNLGERKAVGKIKAQQILLAIPPAADDATKKQIAARTDSLYKRIMAGDNFNRLASGFSNDYISGAAGGMLPDISVGQYDPSFESVLWTLPKDNAVSKPFQTSHGWHIVKRLSLKPIVTDAKDKNNRQDLLQRVMTDSRWQSSRDFIYNEVRSKAGFKRYPYDDAAVWNMTDSVLDLKPMLPNGRTIIATTPMFSIGDSVYTATHWVNYANTFRYKQDGTGAKPHAEVRDEWEKFAMVNYYKDHLESFNEDFRNQMIEFKDGNIFFEVMQQEIWNKAQTDSAGLLNLYEKNKKNYTWNQSADALIFFCSDATTAKAVHEQVKKDPLAWKKIAEQYTEKMVVDSSRFEWEQIPSLGKVIPKAGLLTTPTLNTTDNTSSFAYIINVYPKPLQRTFNEARGLVISDYQNVLEKQFDEMLRKKYPVVIDQKVLAEISK